MDDVKDRLFKLISEHLGVEPDKVTEGAVLEDDLGADSLDCVELVMAVEEEFGVEVKDDETPGMEQTVKVWLDLVQSKVTAAA